MQYWIDGYNLLFYLPKNKGSFEDKRRILISQINEQAKTLSLEITIFFDASDHNQKHNTRSHYESLELIYTHGKQSADDAILEAVEISKNAALLCVVSSDKGVTLRAKAMGAQVLTLPEFLKFLFKKQKKQRERNVQDFQDSPKEMARLLKIFSNPPNEEL
jgi:predicted RNA-binding protein with PIN domain